MPANPFERLARERGEALAERDAALRRVDRVERRQAAFERDQQAWRQEQEAIGQERAEAADRASSDADFEQALTRFYGDEQWRRMDLPVAKRKELLMVRVQQLRAAAPNLSQAQVLEAMHRAELAYEQRRAGA
jgi:hypothetical protein